jgi:hypothetical protein
VFLAATYGLVSIPPTLTIGLLAVGVVGRIYPRASGTAVLFVTMSLLGIANARVGGHLLDRLHGTRLLRSPIGTSISGRHRRLHLVR